jgi:hypothetical protein
MIRCLALHRRLLLVCAFIFAAINVQTARAACTGVIADGPLRLAAAGAENAVSITFLGRASF